MAAESRPCEQFAQNVRYFLRESGMTHEAFARHATISRGRLENALLGRDVWLSTVDECAAGFGVPRCRMLMHESEVAASIVVVPARHVPSRVAFAFHLRRWIRDHGGVLQVAGYFGIQSSLLYRAQRGRRQLRLSSVGIIADAMGRKTWKLVESPAPLAR